MKKAGSRPGVTSDTERRNCYRVGTSRAHVLRGKYRNCDFDEGNDPRRRVRFLDAKEIVEFKRVINSALERKVNAAGVRADVAAADRRASELVKTPSGKGMAMLNDKRGDTPKRTSAASRRAIV